VEGTEIDGDENTPLKPLEFLTGASPYWGVENNNRANHASAAGNPKKGESEK